jgi:hypothetical protein
VLVGDYYGLNYSMINYVLTYTAKARGGGHLWLAEWISFYLNRPRRVSVNFFTPGSLIVGGDASLWVFKPPHRERQAPRPDSHWFTRKR